MNSVTYRYTTKPPYYFSETGSRGYVLAGTLNYFISKYVSTLLISESANVKHTDMFKLTETVNFQRPGRSYLWFSISTKKPRKVREYLSPLSILPDPTVDRSHWTGSNLMCLMIVLGLKHLLGSLQRKVVSILNSAGLVNSYPYNMYILIISP